MVPDSHFGGGGLASPDSVTGLEVSLVPRTDGLTAVLKNA